MHPMTNPDRALFRTTLAILFLGTPAVPVAFFLWSLATFGSFRVGVEYLRGAPVAADSPKLFAGRGIRGQRLTVLPSITNLTNQAIRVSGVTKSCACLIADHLPFVLPPKQTTKIPVDILLGDTTGEFSYRIVFYVETETQVPLIFTVNGTVDPMTR